ncbi:MAG: hypothetical protein HQL34_04870, partial [Alphaproteobacteria bacterium]|nr:hypothetical protein [Alphaproteobacteria bacterium]
AKLLDISARSSGIDLEELRNRLITANETGKWGIVGTRDWRFASECLSMGQDPLVRDEQFVEAYLAALRYSASLPAFRRLVRYYLMNFDPSLPAFRRIGTFLAEHAADCGSWGEQNTKLRVFDADEGPRRLAEAAMAAGKDVRTALENIGFTGSLAAARFAGAAFVSACHKVGKSMETLPQPVTEDLHRLANWAVTNGAFVYGGVPQAKSALARAMLLPWSKKTPSDNVREFVLGFMLGLFKDPRLSRATWIGIADDARSVMLRWLTKASLEQFLGVVDEVVAPERKHMWDARRKFWRAYYDREHMREAWVVFGRRGIGYARRLADRKEHPDAKDLGFGSFAPGSVQDQTQAVLIMRIGSLIVADWSHNGYCHIWHEDDEHAPSLYRQTYTKVELTMSSVFEKKHMGRWQNDVYDFIHRETGVRLSYGEYMT